MSYLPLTGSEVCQMMNLPTDMATNAIWANHQHAIMALLTDYALEDAMSDADTYTPGVPDADPPTSAPEDKTELEVLSYEGETVPVVSLAEATTELIITSDYYYPLRLAYAYLMLSQTAALLNLKTVGEGIVKSVGLDKSSTDLLTGSEIEQFANSMELKALKALGIYISQAGFSRMNELIPAPKRFRIAVI